MIPAASDPHSAEFSAGGCGEAKQEARPDSPPAIGTLLFGAADRRGTFKYHVAICGAEPELAALRLLLLRGRTRAMARWQPTPGFTAATARLLSPPHSKVGPVHKVGLGLLNGSRR